YDENVTDYNRAFFCEFSEANFAPAIYTQATFFLHLGKQHDMSVKMKIGAMRQVTISLCMDWHTKNISSLAWSKMQKRQMI
ncbi:MAG: hypothetical protein RBS81_11630, partial [Tenuifilaceae bacterium]|nr:hypothetical protein [Tenuifilaceae bacterium]